MMGRGDGDDPTKYRKIKSTPMKGHDAKYCNGGTREINAVKNPTNY